MFEDTEASIGGNSKKFAMYAAFGVFITLVFWGTGLLFHDLFSDAFMTNVSAVIGLCIGYVI